MYGRDKWVAIFEIHDYERLNFGLLGAVVHTPKYYAPIEGADPRAAEIWSRTEEGLQRTSLTHADVEGASFDFVYAQANQKRETPEGYLEMRYLDLPKIGVKALWLPRHKIVWTFQVPPWRIGLKERKEYTEARFVELISVAPRKVA